MGTLLIVGAITTEGTIASATLTTGIRSMRRHLSIIPGTSPQALVSSSLSKSASCFGSDGALDGLQADASDYHERFCIEWWRE